MFTFLRFWTITFSLITSFGAQAQTPILSTEKMIASNDELHIDAPSLCNVAQNTLNYMNSQVDDYAIHGGQLGTVEVSLGRVKQTLSFLCQIYREDSVNPGQSRLQSPQFIADNFELIRWRPDLKRVNQHITDSKNQGQIKMLKGIPKNRILLTKYYTKLVRGSIAPSEEHSQALYALPHDEENLTLAQAQQQKHKLTRFKFTRQQVMNGAIHNNQLAKPLIWLSAESLHDVLMQGTAIMEIGHKSRYFNVHRNNGIAYDYTKAKDQQARYWYFKEVPGVMGYGKDADNKIEIKPQVTFAGNIGQLGLGKLIMLGYQENDKQVKRMGILADMGGAFDNNLFQLDMLVDSYYGWSDYHQANKHLPDYVDAWILLKKQ